MEADPEPPRVILLCAGASARLGEPKALAEIGGASVLERLVDATRRVDRSPLVVTGRHHREIERAASRLGLECLHNPNWEDGRTGGLQLAAAAAATRDLLVAPADVPLIAAHTAEALVDEWRACGSPAAGWLAPAWTNTAGTRRHGHPIVIGRALCAAPLATLAAGDSLRLLRRQAERLLDVDVDDEAVLDDLDTPADLALLRARTGR